MQVLRATFCQPVHVPGLSGAHPSATAGNGLYLKVVDVFLALTNGTHTTLVPLSSVRELQVAAETVEAPVTKGKKRV